jgi:hypothetical protein
MDLTEAVMTRDIEIEISKSEFVELTVLNAQHEDPEQDSDFMLVRFLDVEVEAGYEATRDDPGEAAGITGEFDKAVLVLTDDTEVTIPRRLANKVFDAHAETINDMVADMSED